MQSDFTLRESNVLCSYPEYTAHLNEHRNEDGDQFLTIHMDADPESFSPSVMKRMISEFKALRACTDANIFAIEPNPDDDKWQRYVRHMGFNYLLRMGCTDGQFRRCFVSKKEQ